MRKEDRVKGSQGQTGQQQSSGGTSTPQPQPREQMKGSSSQPSPTPPRQGGKLPLPD
jgi:hypothetical protein